LVRPGLTGLAQINGRKSLSWEQRFSYDVQYVDTVSFSKDLAIIVKTFYILFAKKGNESEEKYNIPFFTGSKLE
jgi:lipopolysaccharide/colanic/teichoic acid biosynthesis glycosyltransferase